MQLAIGVIGFIFCFFGYRLLRYAVPIISFIIGYALCGAFLPGLFGIEGTRLLIWSAIGGAALAAVTVISLNVCVFFAGGLAGLAALKFTMEYFPIVFGNTQGAAIALTGVMLFTVSGFIALKLKRPVLCAFTAYTGAYILVSTIVSFATRTNSMLITGSILAITLAGFLAQSRTR